MIWEPKLKKLRLPDSGQGTRATMKKLMGLTIAVLLTASLIYGGVFAFFNDIQASANNQLTAGTLDLSPSTSGSGPAGKYFVTTGGNGVNGNVTFQKLQQGDSGNITWALVNTGSIPGTLSLTSSVTFALGATSEIKTAAGGTGDSNGFLDEYMGVKLQRGVGADQAGATANLTYMLGSSSNYVAFSNLQTALNSAGTSLSANGSSGDAVVYILNWDLNSLFGGANPNIVQSDSAQIDITFTLNQ